MQASLVEIIYLVFSKGYDNTTNSLANTNRGKLEIRISNMKELTSLTMKFRRGKACTML